MSRMMVLPDVWMAAWLSTHRCQNQEKGTCNMSGDRPDNTGDLVKHWWLCNDRAALQIQNLNPQVLTAAVANSSAHKREPASPRSYSRRAAVDVNAYRSVSCRRCCTSRLSCGLRFATRLLHSGYRVHGTFSWHPAQQQHKMLDGIALT